VTKFKKSLKFILSGALGLLILGGILYYVGLGKILGKIAMLGPWGFLLFFLNALLIFLLWTSGWYALLRAYGLRRSWGEALRAMLSGYAINFLTPTLNLGGEPVKAYLASEGFSSSGAEVVATIVVERFINASSILLWALGSGIYLSLTPLISPSLRWGLIIWAGGGMLLAIAVVLGLLKRATLVSRFAFWLQRWLPWGKELLKRVGTEILKVEREMHLAFSEHRRAALTTLLLDLTAATLSYLNPLIFLFFADHQVLSLGELSLIFSLGMFLAMFLWVTPAGLGVAEGGMIGIFGLLGISGASAVAYSFTIKLPSLLLAGVGIAYIAQHGLARLLKDKVDKVEGGPLKDEVTLDHLSADPRLSPADDNGLNP